jgi:hypothetical protein
MYQEFARRSLEDKICWRTKNVHQIAVSISCLPCFMLHKNFNEQISEKYQKQFLPCVVDFSTSSVKLKSISLLLLGRCSSQLCRSRADLNMVCSRAERVFILEHYLALKFLAVLREVDYLECHILTRKCQIRINGNNISGQKRFYL